jgi:ketosteroid isomerase-like protein
MGEHPNVMRSRDAYAAFGRGDLDALREQFADDVVWHVGGRSPLAGDYKGQDEIFGFFGKLFEMTEGTLSIDIHDILANDEHTCVLVTMSAKRGDRMFEQRAVHVFETDEDGRTKAFWSFEEDQAAGDEFWS